MNDYHIVTPFSRPENFQFLKDNLRHHRVTWHLVLNDIDAPPGPLEPWIKICRCYIPPHVDPCYWKLNYFIQTQRPNYDDYYLLQFCDDDALPEDFFCRVRDAKLPEVAYVVSGDNGQVIPQTGLKHPARRYEALPKNMYLGGAGSCRPIVKGLYLYSVVYPNFSGADQIALCAIVQRFPGLNKIEYVNKTAILFNYLEAGRHTKDWRQKNA